MPSADNPLVLRASHILQLAVVALLGLAVVMVHSAGMTVGGRPFTPLTFLSSRHTLYAGLAVVAMMLASRIDLRQFARLRGWMNPLWWLLTASLIMVVLAMVPAFGRSVHGANRWLYLGPQSWGFSFQPSELVKWFMVLALAWWCARQLETMRQFKRGLLPPLVLIAVACGLVVVEDLGTAVLIGMVAAAMLVAGGARLWQLALLVPPALLIVVAAIWQSPYRFARLVAFADPWADPQGIGYHPIQSMLAIAQGGVTGRGLGNGVLKFDYLPEDTTDFVFAIICEELGLAGAGLVIGLLLVILWVGLGILRESRDMFARLFTLGVLLTIGFQALINLAVVTVVVPTKGIALPLVSAGGTGWVVTAFCLGLVASLDVAKRIDDEAQTPEVTAELDNDPLTASA